MTEKNYNQLRAWALAGIDPRVYRRGSTRPADAELQERLKELSSERRRFGYRRLHLLLGREGWKVNWKKLYQIYREEGLSVRKRGGRKRVRPWRSRKGRTRDGRWTSSRTAYPMAAVSGALHHRRLQPGMPGRGRRHLTLRPAGCP